MTAGGSASSMAPVLGQGALIVLVVYLAFMVFIGVLGRRHREEQSLRDFYLGGRGFPFVFLFLTFFATQYSGNTLLGFSGRAYRQGLSYVVSVTFMVLVVTVYLMYAPRLYRLAREFKYLTPADFMAHRYRSHGLRVLSALLLCWGLANYILEQLVAMGHGVVAISGGRLTFMQGVLLLVGVMLVYESLGGMRSVVWTDAVQGVLLLVGCLTLLVILVLGGGGVPDATNQLRELAPPKIELPVGDAIRNWWSNLVLLGIGVSIYPHAIQRIFAARGASGLRRSLAVMAFMPLITTLLAFLIGYVGAARFPTLDSLESDRITIYLLADLGHGGAWAYWLVVVVLVAVLAAIMSTADSALLSIGSMITHDLVQPYLWKKASEPRLLAFGKVFGWLLMAVLVAMAWVSLKSESSLWFLIRLKLEFMTQLAPGLLLGLHWRGARSGAVLTGMVAGTGVTLALWTVPLFSAALSSQPWGIHAGVWGMAVNVGCCLLFSWRPERQTSSALF